MLEDLHHYQTKEADMANSKLVEVKFFGKSHTYDFVIDEKNVTVSDNDGNGLIGKGDKIVEDNLDAFKKYKKIAQAVVTQFRKDLPSELNIAAKQLKDGKVISARRLPGQHGPLPSQRQHDSSYAVDFNG
ncbi:MAG: hypothetical protein HYY43_05365, partial [Deltaproteobacteria bacterium]|nr:hypothetical protein [Deltaproteobacteria bacterium]